MAAIENEALIEAFVKSNKTLEEAIEFFESDMKEKDENPKQMRQRGGRKKKVSK